MKLKGVFVFSVSSVSTFWGDPDPTPVVNGVFSTIEKAESFVKKRNAKNEYETYEIEKIKIDKEIL